MAAISVVERAVGSIDRRSFLPPEFRELPADVTDSSAIPFGDGFQTVPTAQVTELMVELLALTPDDAVMEIGTGSGYQAAVLARLAREVHTLEVKPIETSLLDLLPRNVKIYQRNGLYGVPEMMFDAILVTCGVPAICVSWINQLKEGGRLVLPIGDSYGHAIRKYIKVNGFLRDQGDFAYARFVPFEHAAL